MDSEKLAGCREEFEKWITAQSTPSMLPIRRYAGGYMDRFIDGQWDAFRQAWTRPGVTVPVEPTHDMAWAGTAAMNDREKAVEAQGYTRDFKPDMCRAIYKAMLEARPK